VSDWSTIFLGVIAVATLLMATLQVGAILAAVRLARRVQRLADELHGEVKPLVARAQEVAEHAARVSSLAVAQVERADQMMAVLTRRLDETALILQRAIVTPAREGIAVISALKAGLSALRGARPRPPGSGRIEEEDALFIG
jgi:hypothetical protein